MYYNNVLPFLKKSPLVSNTEEIIHMDDIFFPFSVENPLDDEQLYRDIFEGQVPIVLHVQPLDIYILDLPLQEANWYQRQNKSYLCEVREIDYSKIARDIEIDDLPEDMSVLNAEYQVYYRESNAMSKEFITEEALITASTNGVTYRNMTTELSPERELRVIMERKINELDVEDYAMGEPSIDDSGALNEIELRLENYITGDYVTDRIPTLIGPTAVLKSATIKKLAKKHDRRLLDLRTAFMTRLDFEGLSEKVDGPGGEVLSYNSPMLDIIKATDKFVEYAKAAVPKIEARLEEVDSESQEYHDLQVMLEEYKELRKPPILFFDEITRAEKPIRDAMTTMLHDKEFMGYSMKKARIIAATNFPTQVIDAEDDEELKDIIWELKGMYLTDKIDDKATLDRFEPLIVTPEVVEGTWYNWADAEFEEGKTNIHKHVLEFLDENPQYAYYFDGVIQDFKQSKDFDVLITSPFPNYRTWEMITKYLYKTDETDGAINPSQLKGLVGQDIGQQFVDFLFENEYYTKNVSADDDQMTSCVDEAMKKNVPTMLLGPSSIGKTSRIHEAAERNGIKEENIIGINLAMQDRVDILGPPMKVDLASYVGGLGIDMEETDFSRELKDLIKDVGLPEKVTIKAPKSNLKTKLQNAKEDEEPIVLFFDEINRVNNEAVMTAVFEAISDQRLMGVEFPEEQVRIFAAANVGEGYNVRDFDPAFAARFNLYHKEGYELEDASNIRNYMKEHGYSPYIVKYFDNLSDEKLIEIVSKIEERTLEKAVPSLRAFSDLNDLLGDTRNAELMSGRMIFQNDDIDEIYRGFFRKSMSETDNEDVKKICDYIDSVGSNWAGLGSGFKATVGDSSVHPDELLRDLRDIWQDIKDSGISDETYNSIYEDYEMELQAIVKIINGMFLIEDKIENRRERVFNMIIGDESTDFTRYYNKHSGTQVVDIKLEDLKDKSLMEPYVKDKMAAVDDPYESVEVGINHCEEFYDYFSDSLTPDHYDEFFIQIADKMPSQEAALNLVRKLTGRMSLEDMLIQAEKKEDFVNRIFEKAGRRISDEELQQAEELEGETPKILDV